jgi:hypothetical protein
MDQSLLKLRTLGDLKRAGYQTKPVRIEMRDNLLGRLRRKEKVLPESSAMTTRCCRKSKTVFLPVIT